jgi:hypothetical protein
MTWKGAKTPPLKMKDLYWLAGLMEGEGSPTWAGGTKRESDGVRRRNIAFSLNMVDEDVVARVARMFGVRYHKIKRKPPSQDEYQTRVVGRSAAQWLMTLYPLFHSRRKAKIRALLQEWKKPVPIGRGGFVNLRPRKKTRNT